MAQTAEQISQLRPSVRSLRVARRHAAVVFPGQSRRAAANAVADRKMRAPVVFLLWALEVQAISMTVSVSVSVSVAWPGPDRRGEHKCSRGGEEECVSHSPNLVAAIH